MSTSHARRKAKPKQRTSNPHPYVAWRDGKPRFQPGPGLRRQGYRLQDLRHADGRWYTRGEAIDWSVKFCSRLEDERHQVAALNAQYHQGLSL